MRPLIVAAALLLSVGASAQAPTLETCRPPASERLLFYTTDTLGEFPFTYVAGTKGHLKMMKGEYLLENRTNTYSLPENAPDGRPTYLITGWKHETTKPSNNVTITTIGYSAGFHVTGPAMDHKNKAVYYISRHCVLNDTNGVDVQDPTTVDVKLGGTQQQDPHGGSSALNPACTIESSFSTWLFGLQRYNWESNTWDLIHQGTATSFPGNNEFNQEHWQLAFDPNTNTLWYNIYQSALTGVQITGEDNFVSTDLYRMNTAVSAGDKMALPTKVFTISTTEQGAYHQMTFDCESNLFVQDYGKVHMLATTANPITMTYPVPKTHIKTTLCSGSTSCIIGGMGIDPVNRIVYYAVYIVSDRVYQIRRTNYLGTNDNCMYTRMLYEFSNLGQTIMNMDVDVANQHLYLVSYGSQVKGRSIQRFDILPEGVNATACLWGYQTDCKFRQNGEEHIIGYSDAADAAYKVGSDHASNFANGEVLSYDSGNTIFGVVGPTVIEPRGKCNYTWQKNHVHPRDRVVNYQCNPINASEDFTRRIFYQLDPGLASDRTHWLMEHRGWAEMTLSGSAIFTQGTYRQRFYYNSKDRDYNTINYIHNGGLDQSDDITWKRRGVTVAGPTYSKKQRMIYWMSCEYGYFTETCMEFAIWRMNVDTMVKEKVLQQPKQLMPAPNQYTWEKVVLAIDDQREVLYVLLTPYNGYASPTDQYSVAEQLYSYDLKDQTLPLPECSGQLEVEFSELGGSIRSMHVDSCDGSVWIQETASIWRWRVKETQLTEWLNIGVVINSTSSTNLTAGQSRYFGGMALDDQDGYIYATYLSGFSGTSAKRGIIRIRKSNPNDIEYLYRNAIYELSYRASNGGRPQYLRQIALDLVNRQIYVISYYTNSYQRSLLMVPMPGHVNFTGGDAFVCLYGHDSIPHASGMGNRDCVYQGPEPTEGNYTGYGVPIPQGAIYHLTQSPALVLLPGPAGQISNPATPPCGAIPTSAGCATPVPPTANLTSSDVAGSGSGTDNDLPTVAPSPFPAGTPVSGSTTAYTPGVCCSNGLCDSPPSPLVKRTLVSGRQYRDYFSISTLLKTGGRSIPSDATNLEIHVKGEGGTQFRFMTLTSTEYQKFSISRDYEYYSNVTDLEWSTCSSKGMQFPDSDTASTMYNSLRLVVDYDEPENNPVYNISVSTVVTTTAPTTSVAPATGGSSGSGSPANSPTAGANGLPTVAPSPFPEGTPVSGSTTSYTPDNCCGNGQCSTGSPQQKSTLVTGRQYRDYYIVSDLLKNGDSSAEIPADATKLEIHVKGGDGTQIRFMALTYNEYQKFGSESYQYYADATDLEWTTCSSKGLEFNDAETATNLYESMRLIVDYDEPNDNAAYTISVSTGAAALKVLLVGIVTLIAVLMA